MDGGWDSSKISYHVASSSWTRASSCLTLKANVMRLELQLEFGEKTVENNHQDFFGSPSKIERGGFGEHQNIHISWMFILVAKTK